MTEIAAEIDHYLKRLFPVCRSITGPGNRESLRILQEIAPLEIKEYPSGTPVYDWIIPDEWIVCDAWIKDANGSKLVDFRNSNIHLVGYSEPIKRKIDFFELKNHLHFRDDLPEAVPYRTTYYQRNWGFCVTRHQYEMLKQAKEPFEIFVDSEFKKDGSLTIGELLIPGMSAEEILISTYICHPSLANDNLSGMVMTSFLARELLRQKPARYSYRIVWVPETIGAIAYCAFNEAALKKIRQGFVVTCVGGPGKYGYKQSFEPAHALNSAIEESFRAEGIGDYITYPFDIHGSDERQYSSQGFRINVASISKDRYYEYPFYHTSLDDLSFISASNVSRSLDLHLGVLKRLNEWDDGPIYRRLDPHCEVMLSKYGLYPETGGGQLPNTVITELDLRLWLLFLCDGRQPLYVIANRLGVPLAHLQREAHLLEQKGLLVQSRE
jgi:aminopeptidase-like protein